MTRRGFSNGDISTVMSPRTVITWAENARIFGELGLAFRLTFLNKCDEAERPVVAEYYQRCFNQELPDSVIRASRVHCTIRILSPGRTAPGRCRCAAPFGQAPPPGDPRRWSSRMKPGTRPGPLPGRPPEP